MGLLNFIKKNSSEDDAPASRQPRSSAIEDDLLDTELPQKQRARRRLIGAIVLVLGAFGLLPLVLDKSPKPINPNITIQVPTDSEAGTDKAVSTQISTADTAEKTSAVAASQVAVDSLDKGETVVTDKSTVAKTAGKTIAAAAAIATVAKVAAIDKPDAVAVEKANRDKEDKVAKAAREAAAKEQADKAQAAKLQAEKDKAAHDKAVKDKATQDKATADTAASEKDKAAKDKAAKEKAAKEKAAKEKAAKEKIAKEKAAKAKADKDKAAQTKTDKDPIAAIAEASNKHSKYIILIGAFSSEEKVKDWRAKMKEAKVTSYVEHKKLADGERILLRAGPYKDRASAEAAEKKLKSLGLSAKLVEQ